MIIIFQDIFMGFSYKNGILHAEDVDIYQLSKAFTTPFYLYSKSSFENNFNQLGNPLKSSLNRDFLIAFSVKSCPNINILKILQSCGAGADCVSIGEVFRAIKAGFLPKNIVFAGVGKTRYELTQAAKLQIGQINVESFSELELLNDICAENGLVSDVAVRINPDIDAKTHKNITTGQKDNKFGILVSDFLGYYDKIKTYKNINLIGLSVHIGSQISDIVPMKNSFQALVSLTKMLISEGFDIKTIDFGGGLGVPYNNETHLIPKDTYINEIVAALEDLPSNVRLIIEPGRFIACDSGVLVSKVNYIKHTSAKDFAILDAGMNDLMRPAIYGAFHSIIPIKESQISTKYDIVGPVCESSCTFAKDRPMPILNAGDLVAILNAGAYGASMSNNYNTRLLPIEILADKSNTKIIRKLQTYDDLFALEV